MMNLFCKVVCIERFKSRYLKLKGVYFGIFLIIIMVSGCINNDTKRFWGTDGSGKGKIFPNDPVMVGSSGTWEITYESEEGIRKGGGILLQVSMFWGWSAPQNDDSEAPGYTTVRISPRNIPYVTRFPVGHSMQLLFLKEGLPAGSTVTFIYGDTLSSGNVLAKAKVDIYADGHQEFILKTDVDGDGVYREIDSQPWLMVKSRQAVRCKVVVPTFIGVGKKFNVNVTMVDEMNNWDKGYSGSVHIESKPSSKIRITRELRKEDQGNCKIEISIDQPGRYRIIARTDDGLTGISEPVNVGMKGLPGNLYWGDIHGHSNFSDGTGTAEDYYHYAKYVAGLDIAALTDHGNLGIRRLQGKEWNKYKNVCEQFNVPESFVTFPAYEYTNWKSGHKNIYFLVPPPDIKTASQPGTSSPFELYKSYEGLQFLSIPHHPGGGPVATDWQNFISNPSPLVEISSIHGTSETFNTSRRIYKPVSTGFVNYALSLGHVLGFIGSGDSHDGHPGVYSKGRNFGLMGVWSKKLDRTTIWESMETRSTFATTGARIALTFSINGYFMGSIMEPVESLPSPLEIIARVWGTGDIEKVFLIKNGNVIHEILGKSETIDFKYVDPINPIAGTYYYLKVIQYDGEMAWSSPIYIR